jgi:transposase-like protein
MYVKELQVAEGRGRRRHSAEFKAKLVEECRQPGMSVARVARDNGVNANLLHQWIVSSRARNVGVAAVPQVGESFVPVQISQSGAVATTVAPIVVEIQRGSATVTVNWPIEAAAECADWLRAWLR